jgi:hypothetical protein
VTHVVEVDTLVPRRFHGTSPRPGPEVPLQRGAQFGTCQAL